MFSFWILYVCSVNIVHLRVLRHHYIYELGLLPMFLRSAVIFKRVALPDWPAKHVCYISRMSEGIWNTGWSVLQIKDRRKLSSPLACTFNFSHWQAHGNKSTFAYRTTSSTRVSCTAFNWERLTDWYVRTGVLCGGAFNTFSWCLIPVGDGLIFGMIGGWL